LKVTVDEKIELQTDWQKASTIKNWEEKERNDLLGNHHHHHLIAMSMQPVEYC